MQDAYLMRVINASNVCLLLAKGPGAVVHAELVIPLSPRSQSAAQTVSALNCVPAKVALGRYDSSQGKFLDCVMDAQFPESVLFRVNYLGRKKNR